ncbi:5-methyltetrahydropteroyltriglutamate--homocysteine S-methyltransferase [Metabacillus malikii]|uniref:5-methyltetrahydropteroyltriglutamate--homocysteine methyltransferase n=1 Tax=Metabacillus malikii TaxID=1504265 RepID=A0ABT9ZJS5_9BACI|nr:5-methyltetrahydropteroyltriglutamate--homocysteine methyltransferase [Metabacillus malikii]
MLKSSNIGYPRIGENREWKRTLERYWTGQVNEEQFLQDMKQIRLSHLRKQKELGIELIPVGDFSYYDHVLDTAVMFNLIPSRFKQEDETISLSKYFEIARGSDGKVAAEMTKWFNTNYHYIVPELQNAEPKLTHNRLLELYNEAKVNLGINGKPVIVGPITLLSCSKGFTETNREKLLQSLIPLYIEVFNELKDAGAEWIQIDEPILVRDKETNIVAELQHVYHEFHKHVKGINLIIQTYFDSTEYYNELIQLPVKGIGLDFVHDDGENLQQLLNSDFPQDKILFAGIIDGRNIWKTKLLNKYQLVQELLTVVDSCRLFLQPSCSLLHVPVTVNNEEKLDLQVKEALAFADEKLNEITLLSRVLNEEEPFSTIETYDVAVDTIAKSSVRNVEHVQNAIINLNQYSTSRIEAAERKKLHAKRWKLPILPTTTIGSFPQTKEIRKQRLRWRKGEITNHQYETFIQNEIKKWIKIQEDLNLDVLVHGEFERTDMVEFFGEKFEGVAITEFGWVQSYGSRCVKPPIIFGDVYCKENMTVKETVYAQSLTKKPVKGMLTGPVTIINWSFVRDDLPFADVLNQVALTIRKEVEALEQSGISMIQVDEAALREGLPLKQKKKDLYLNSAVYAFKLATSSVQDNTQIHTHMCYSNFDDIIHAIDALDADVISIETSRSHGELIASFEEHHYQKGIGLGVYDIHSPRVPTLEELIQNIERALEALDYRAFWVNPDCGLKTRGESETIAALKVMVEAAHLYRSKLQTVSKV